MAVKIKMCGRISRQYCVVCLMLLAFQTRLHSCETNGTTTTPSSFVHPENSTTLVKNQNTDGASVQESVTLAPETITEDVLNVDYQSTEPNVRDKEIERKDKQEYFLKLLFDKYGKDGTISYEGFEHLMFSLGLGNIKIRHSLADHWNRGLFKEFHENHVHAIDDEGDHDDHDHGSHDHGSHDHGTHDHDHGSHDHDHGSHDHDHGAHDHDHGSHDHDHGSHDHDHGSDDEHEYAFLADLFDDPTTASPLVTTQTPKKQRHKNVQDKAISPVIRKGNDVTTGRSQEATPTDVKTPSVESSTEESSDTKYSKCMSPPSLLHTFQLSEGITRDGFLKLCPAIIYQIDIHKCSRNRCGQTTQVSVGAHVTSHDHHDHDHAHNHDHVHKHAVNRTTAGWDFFSIPVEVWGYSTLSVIVISLVGLCGVAIVPVIQKVFYSHLIQYLVALAVGSLTGDAMLHLLPHAIAKHSHDAPADDHGHSHDDEGSHLDGVWKGLVGLSGIYIFFIMERLMVIINEHRRRKPKKKKGRFRKLEDGSNKIGNKLCNHQVLYKSCEDIVVVMHHDKAIKDLAHEAAGRSCKHSGSEDGEESEHLSEVTNETVADDGSEAPSRRGHGHSHGGHGHSHNHKVPTSVASVAWMVILGDGLHNFSDGLAIGAAFANSLTGGLSTSIAVFCHELPHELGDFAVLLHAGMSVKQALVYNGVSSILCFLGMLIGVAVGNMSGASLWIFSLTAGMFLYIALVDMLPEMANVDSKANSILHFVLQNFGLMTGFAIMLLIAVYEDKIMIEL